jgi:hypothetical protein
MGFVDGLERAKGTENLIIYRRHTQYTLNKIAFVPGIYSVSAIY